MFNLGLGGGANKGNIRGEPKPNEIPAYLRAAVPIFEPMNYVSTHFVMTLYTDKNFTNPVDEVPRKTTVRLLAQDLQNKHIVQIMFGHRKGFINIIQQQAIAIQKDDVKLIRMNFDNVSSTVLNAIEGTLNGCVWKYELTPGLICQSLFSILMRKSVEKESAVVLELQPKTPIIILQIGDRQRVMVRSMVPFSKAGWVSTVDQRNRPLLGFFIPPIETQHVEIGRRMEIKATGRITKEEPDRSDELTDDENPHLLGQKLYQKVARGTIVWIIQGPRLGSTEHRFRVVTEPTELTGWVSAKNEQKHLLIGEFGTECTKEILAFFFHAAANNVNGMHVMLTAQKKKWWERTARPPIEDINVLDPVGRSALFYSMGFGSIDTLRFLFNGTKMNLDIELRDRHRRNPVHYLAMRMRGSITLEENYIHCLEEYLEITRDRKIINEKDYKGNTPIMYAIIHDNPLIAKRLLDLSANVSIKNKEGLTAMMMAAYAEDEYVIKLLKAKGADNQEASFFGKQTHWRLRQNMAVIKRQKDLDIEEDAAEAERELRKIKRKDDYNYGLRESGTRQKRRNRSASPRPAADVPTGRQRSRSEVPAARNTKSEGKRPTAKKAGRKASTAR